MSWKAHLPEIFLGISLVMIAIEAALGRMALVTARYRTRDTFASLGMQAGNIAMNLLMAGIVFAGLSAAYKVRVFTVSPSSPWAWVAIFFLDDFIYYWFHRISHECRFWWAAHVNHHSSQEYNLSTALRQSWTSVIVGTWTPWIPLALLGFPPAMILAQQGFNLFYQFWIHTESVHRMPAWFEYLFNTPSHHRVHHAANPRYLDRNYAGVLMLWDRMFGTFVEEKDEEPPRYGIVKNIETFNPIRIAFHEWAAIAREVLAAGSVREALGALFGPPGWRADGRGLTSKNIRAGWQAGHPLAVALLACAFLCAAGSALARHRSESSAATPGDFAYYLLSLSWSPAFCLSSPGAAECNGPRRFGFIVHGLWPQYEQGWPEHCDVHRPVPDDVVQGVSDLMPARALVYHEWSAHGTCSGLEPAEFFALVRRAYAGIAIPQDLSSPTHAIEQPPAAIAAAFLHANPHLEPQSVVVTCTGQGEPRLREVHLCLDRDLKPRACSADALRGACRAPQVIVPPIR